MNIVLILKDGARIKIGTTKDRLTGLGNHSEMVQGMPIPPKDSTITLLGRNYIIKNKPHFNLDRHEIELVSELSWLTQIGYLVYVFVEHLQALNENLSDLLVKHTNGLSDGVVEQRFIDFSRSVLPEYVVSEEDIQVMRRTGNWLKTIEYDRSERNDEKRKV